MAGPNTATWGDGVAQGFTNGVTYDLVYLNRPHFSVKVTNLSINAPLWFTVSEKGGACPVPSIGGGPGQYCAASAGSGTSINVRHNGLFGGIIQIISSASVSYLVEAQGAHATS